MDDFMDLIGGVADMFGLGEVVKGALGGSGISAYAEGRSTQTGAGADGEVPYVYERVLTRPRKLNINDR
jgi:hypothetical protein